MLIMHPCTPSACPLESSTLPPAGAAHRPKASVRRLTAAGCCRAPAALRPERSAYHRAACPHGQQGIALIVGLVILVILALLGTTAYSVATQEERMAGNARDHARAFQAAEFALRECETAVRSGPVFQPVAAATPGLGMLVAPSSGQWTGDSAVSAWQQYALTPVGFASDAPVKPICIAEDFQGYSPIPGKTKNIIPHTARVTAQGYGITTGANVTLVSYVKY
jgi:type IV pilus assembly protein PilX